MRLTEVLLILFLIPTSLCYIDAECVQKIEKECHDEISKMTNLGHKIRNSLLPPLSGVIAEYDVLVENAMNCSTNLWCTQFATRKEIYDSIREVHVAENDYWFDNECITKVFMVIYKGKFECANDFDFANKNATIKRKAYTDGKTCFLEMAQANCSSEHYNFLEKNYDDLMSTYTIEPKDNGLCNSAYLKFDLFQCAPLNGYLDSIWDDPANLTDFQMDHADGSCRQFQRCVEQSCVYLDMKKEDPHVIDFGKVCADIETFLDSMRVLFFKIPKIRKLECLKKMTVWNLYKDFDRCHRTKSGMDCWTEILWDSRLCPRDPRGILRGGKIHPL